MASKQAACLNCRKSKIKCKREVGAAVCEKCEQTKTECIIPNFHIGRQKGVKKYVLVRRIVGLLTYTSSKRTGLDKAIFQIEEAIKKSRSDSFSKEGTLEQLQQLLGEVRGVQEASDADAASISIPQLTERDGSGHPSDDQLALDDAENPLQLLARASDLRLTSPQSGDASASTPGSRYYTNESNDAVDVHRFFLPMKAYLDQGPDLDPIDVGLVTLEEADMLLSFFHDRLAHTRWGLDPQVHTLHFVRNRSAFLFTSLLTASARFLPSTAAVAKRLLHHRLYLVQQIISRRFRSVEIILAFMVNVPWMHPGAHAGDDDTGYFISLALSLALDLSLNKIIVPSQSFEPDALKRIPKADCIDATRALTMDGFEDVDPKSEWGQRLLRRRERVWIALFVLERGVCLARGRSYSVPITPLVMYCDKWHNNAVAHTQDGALISMAVLRRDLDGLFTSVRSRCDSYRVIDVGSKVADEIEATIEGFFTRWNTAWTSAIGDGEHRTLPPYVEILVTHTRLSIYSGVINHPTAPQEVKRQFRASALSSALNVMRAAIQGESRLKSMPNNTVIMICFAACIALTLSTASSSGSHNLAPSVRNLIDETATSLERIGSTPSHRNGTSVLYGKYLHELVKDAPAIATNQHQYQSVANLAPQTTTPLDPAMFATASDHVDTFGHAQYPLNWGEPLQFSAMSGNEVIETVMNSGDFESALFDIPMEDMNSFAWMDWMNPPDFGFQ
ncbi:hypothetical protein B0J11DRAFT_267172 [Dendryphion nanum]|uniref:Zn(2)-C6 fungal-type domain-containing protein n=1 Tax=Dendryphion nanum TaxID=256645 RepID=A0A9P9IR91_9PLEO|nr:hypothetical protein B0J11DRAFT_267172 [Dendryphion nanum]